MKQRASLPGILAVVLCLFAGSAAFAQETRGSIEGVVKDSSGAVLPGATVEARSPALVGVSSVEQLDDNLAALERPAFTDDELAEIDRHATDAGVNIWAASSAT